MKICVVGGGPSAFSFAKNALSRIPHVAIDIFDKGPLPFGLLRYGVAPDMVEKRKMAAAFLPLLSHPRVKYFARTEVGKSPTLASLQGGYDAIVLATGAGPAKRLEVPGASSALSGHDVVNWVNSNEAARMPAVGRKVAIVGNGNVALDVARILLKMPGLEKFIVSPEVRKQVAQMCVDSIHVFGRGAPDAAAFTNPVLSELTSMENVEVGISEDTRDWIAKYKSGEDVPRPLRRRMELLSGSGEGGKEKSLVFRFWERPVSIEQSKDMLVLTTESSRPGDAKSRKERERQTPTQTHRDAFDTVISCIGYERPDHTRLLEGVTKPVFLLGWARTGAVGNIDNTVFESIDLATSLLDVERTAAPAAQLARPADPVPSEDLHLDSARATYTHTHTPTPQNLCGAEAA